MTSLAIVGHEAAKFTPVNEGAARNFIHGAIRARRPDRIESGECPLGGIDVWAREIATYTGYRLVSTQENARLFVPRAPMQNAWDGAYGFKARNLDLAACDHCICIVVRELPDTYRGRRFDFCYHCKDRNPPHIKSGGCWTAWKCKSREWVIL